MCNDMSPPSAGLKPATSSTPPQPPQQQQPQQPSQQLLAQTDAPSTLLNLPVELVLNILSHISPAHVALFSLTCKASFRLVRGTDYGKICLASLHSALMTNLEEPQRERIKFLDLLVRDLPRLFACKRCSKLHQSPTIIAGEDGHVDEEDIILARHPPASGEKGLMTFGPLWPQFAFSWYDGFRATGHDSNGSGSQGATSHLAISTDWKLTRLGSSCNNPDFLHGYVKLDTEAVVVDGSLLFHKTQRILLLPDKVKPFLRANAPRPMEHVFQFCGHGAELASSFQPGLDFVHWDTFEKPSVHGTIARFIDMAKDKAGLAGPAEPAGWDLAGANPRLHPFSLTGCRHCTTDNAVTVHNHGRAGVEIVCDVFQDLGGCARAPPLDERWEYCWAAGRMLRYQNVMYRRQALPMIDPGLFPTAPGKSARRHPSAPSIRDVWELHEYERRARLRWS